MIETIKASHVAPKFRPVHDAFGDAIKARVLSFNPQNPNWFCLYVYLGIVTDSDGIKRDRFKNMTTLQQVDH